MAEIRTIQDGRAYERQMLIDGQVVCWLFVIDYQMRVGAARVRMAGIAGVETRREHRNKGYMRTLFEDTVRYMTDQGYDVSMLFGIPNFYTKFGYAVCLSEHKQVVPTRDAEEAKSQAVHLSTCKLEAEDIDAVLELYNRSNTSRTATLIRLKEYFTGFNKGTWWDRAADTLAWKDAAGQLVAYAAFDRSDRVVNIVEAESTDAKLYPTLLYELAKMAVDKRCGEVNLYQPPDHPFAEFVQRYGCKWETTCEKNGGGMMRILNLRSLFAKIAPELTRRVALSPLSSGSSALALETDIGQVTVQAQNGAVAVADSGQNDLRLALSQDRLIQLLMGYRSGRDVLNDPAVQSEGAVLPWLDALFPKGYPYVWAADCF